MTELLPELVPLEDAASWLSHKMGYTVSIEALERLLLERGVEISYTHKYNNDPDRGKGGRPYTLVNSRKYVQREILIGLAEKTEELASAGDDTAYRNPPRVPVSPLQDEAILKALRNLGHDPYNLPNGSPGKAGVRSEVARLVIDNQLFTSHAFKHAWTRFLERTRGNT